MLERKTAHRMAVEPFLSSFFIFLRKRKKKMKTVKILPLQKDKYRV